MQNNNEVAMTKYYAGIVSPASNYVIGIRGGAVRCSHKMIAQQFDSVEEANAALVLFIERLEARKSAPEKCGQRNRNVSARDVSYHTFVRPTTEFV